jgi:hypothetical protein
MLVRATLRRARRGCVAKAGRTETAPGRGYVQANNAKPVSDHHPVKIRIIAGDGLGPSNTRVTFDETGAYAGKVNLNVVLHFRRGN